MKINRLIAGAVAFACMSSVNAFAADSSTTNTFSDVDASTAVGKAISAMYEAGYVAGYEDGTFKPNGNITRAELTRVFNQVFGYEADETKLASMKDFSDNSDSAAWYYNDVRIAQSNGYINGFGDNSFRPKDNFTRQQTCVVLAQAAKLSDEGADEVTISDEVSSWAEAYVKSAIAAGAFSLETGNTFRATQNITRGEVCLALSKYIGSADKTETTTVSASTTTEATTKSDSSTESTTTSATTTTKKTTSGGGGGGGSSSSSSSKSTTTTTTTSATTTTTESTTEATTSKKTETTTKEATTELTTTEPVTLNSEQKRALKGIISDTKSYLIPNSKTSGEKELGQVILNAMQAYYNDPTYDILVDIATAKELYNALSSDEKDEFQTLAISSLSMSDISTLRPLFEGFI